MKPISIFCITSRVETNRSYYAQFQLGPFAFGQGITVANSLRRSLLSELPGLAITEIEIPGIKHEYSSLPGLRESVLELLLNLRQIVFCSEFYLKQPKFGYINFTGPGVIRAHNMQLPCYIKCVDPEQYIATITYDTAFCVKFLICQGKQKLPNAPSRLTWPNREVENLLAFPSGPPSRVDKGGRKQNSVISQKKNLLSLTGQRKLKSTLQILETKQNFTLPLDAIFMPVTKVNYLIEIDDKVQPFTDRVILELWTNGSIHPRQAIHQAAHNLVKLFAPLREPQIIKTLAQKSKPLEFNKKSKATYLKPEFLDIDIANLELSSHSYTCLKGANIHLIKHLLQFSKQKLLLINNFGEESCNDVENALKIFGLNLAESNKNTTI